jgi:hypothetical protein
MEVKEMDLKNYCCLNRNRFVIDPESDAEWYFGNQQVNNELLTRIRNDFLVRGVPKCGILGRFGYGKTHTLFHLKYLFESEQDTYPAVPLILRIAPYDESTPGLNGLKYIHGKMLDAMGENFMREIVRGFNNLPGSGTGELSTEILKNIKFGDENLKSSLSSLLSAYFLRDVKSTMSAWQWLKGDKITKSNELDDVGVKKNLETAGDMLNVILNIGTLTRIVKGTGIVFLMDEAQALNEVKKRAIEIHDAFLQMAEPDNSDIGFVFAYFGTGLNAIPKVFSTPDDILSRLGVTQTNIQVAIKDLQRLISTKSDMREFIDNVLCSIIDTEKAQIFINEMKLKEKLKPDQIPFTDDALDRLTQVMYEKEPNRNARMIIQTLAQLSAEAYQKGKRENKYIVADSEFIEPFVRDI